MKYWQKTLKVDVILIFEFLNSEIRITSTYWLFCQAARISFRKTSVGFTFYNYVTHNHHQFSLCTNITDGLFLPSVIKSVCC